MHQQRFELLLYGLNKAMMHRAKYELNSQLLFSTTISITTFFLLILPIIDLEIISRNFFCQQVGTEIDT